MKKLFLISLFVISIFSQKLFVYAQQTPTTTYSAVNSSKTFNSIFVNELHFTIQIQEDERSVAFVTEATGKNSYKITATIINDDKLDKAFIPSQKVFLVKPANKSYTYFGNLVFNHRYRILVTGKNDSDASSLEKNLGEFTFINNYDTPQIIDVFADYYGGSTVINPVDEPNVDIQKNLYTNNSPATGAPASTAAVAPTGAAPGGLVTCGRFQGDIPCGLVELFNLLNRIIKFVIQDIFFPIFIFAVFYLGYVFITSQGNSAAWATAKKLAWNMVLGVLMILGGWLVVYTALNVLGAKDATTYFQK